MKSVIGKLLALQIVCFLAGVSILYVLLDRTLWMDATTQFHDVGRTVAEAAAKSCETPLIFHDLVSVQSVLDASSKTSNVEWAYVTSPNGAVIAHTFVPEFPKRLLATTREKLFAGIPWPAIASKKVVSTFDAPILAGIVGDVHIGINQDYYAGAIVNAERVVLISVFTVSLVLIGGLFLFTRRILAPIHPLISNARRLAENPRADIPELRVRAHDEIGLLTTTFNKMAADIRQSHDKLETRAAERTMALAVANEGLQGEIRERNHAEQALRESEERYRSVVEQVTEVIFAADVEGHWTFLNHAWTQITGFTVEESLGQPLFHYVFEDDLPLCLALFESLIKLERHSCTVELRSITKASGLRWVEVNAKGTVDGDGQLVSIAGTFSDISERKQAEQQLQFLAQHDALTGFPNRLLFQDRVRTALERMQRSGMAIAILFVDLDNFKTVNDTLGHEAGDLLLKYIGECLKASSRIDDTTCRLGGDEFTLLLEGLTDTNGAIRTADRIAKLLAQPIQLGEHEIFASASIGIVYTVDPQDTCESLLRDADTAMYHAKANGKSGHVLYEPNMNADAIERLEIETGLRFAMERHELRVYYQPLIDLETGHMTGMEALVRWEHPTRGLILPGAFVPIAEETGMIVPIGYWVLEEACRQAKTWQTLYPAYSSLIVNVNLSGRQLVRPDVIEQIEQIVLQTGIDPSHLKLEITESVMIANIDDALIKLHQLKALGIKLALDDFGTGYSSISSLDRLPLDSVKIDRSFIRHIADQEETRSIVEAIVMLAKALRMEVTGEGIETEFQVTYLQSLGCHLGQGYYFARPLASSVLEEQMATGQLPYFNPKTQWERHQIEYMLSAA